MSSPTSTVLTTPTRKRVLKHGLAWRRAMRRAGLNDTDPQEGTEKNRIAHLFYTWQSLNDTDPQEGTETLAQHQGEGEVFQS